MELNLQALSKQFSFEPYFFNTGEMIYRAGSIINELFYITSGITRAYYLYEGKEINLRLVASGNVALQYASFITQTPATEYIECVTPCSGYRVKLNWQLCQDQSNALVQSYLRQLAENHYLAMERRLFTLQHKQGKDRYRYFIKHMPSEIVENTPDLHIASYLGLTPESFSRIKRELIK